MSNDSSYGAGISGHSDPRVQEATAHLLVSLGAVNGRTADKIEARLSDLTSDHTVASPTIIATARCLNGTIEGDGTSGFEAENIGISSDGRYVVFSSAATNLVFNDTNNAIDVFRYDRTNNTFARADVGLSGSQSGSGGLNPSISAD